MNILSKKKNGFEIILSYYEGVTSEELTEQIDKEYINKEVNGITYKYIEIESETTDGDKLQNHQYVYDYNGTIYSIVIKSINDAESVEKAFMNTVSFGENK